MSSHLSRRPWLRPGLAATLTVGMATTLLACSPSAGDSPDEGDTLVIYSGRNENLIGPVLDGLEDAIGIPVEVRYASSSELAAQLLEEGDATQADLFFSQDAGALGALAKADMLTPIDDTVLEPVPAEYRDGDGRWVATSGRARVLAYHPDRVDATTLSAVDDLLDPDLAGRIGFAPSNASFHAFVTALRVDRGEDGARTWLMQFAETSPQAYENNNAVLDAVDRGEVAVGLINHYYWYARVAELGEDAVNARIHHLGSDDPGALVNVAGVGVLATTDNHDAAMAAVEHLLSPEVQQFFVDTTFEYPVVPGVEHQLPQLTDRHRIDLNDLDTLAETLALLDEVGLT